MQFVYHSNHNNNKPKQNILHTQKFAVSKIFQQYSFKNAILLLEASEPFDLNTIFNIINRPAETNNWPLPLVKDAQIVNDNMMQGWSMCDFLSERAYLVGALFCALE